MNTINLPAPPPRAPKKPARPIEPRRSNREKRSREYGDGVYLQALIDDLPENVSTSEVEVCLSGDGYDGYHSVAVEWYEEIVDPRYEEKLAKFNTKMVIYQLELAKYTQEKIRYDADKKAWDDTRREQEIRELEQRLITLRKENWQTKPSGE